MVYQKHDAFVSQQVLTKVKSLQLAAVENGDQVLHSFFGDIVGGQVEELKRGQLSIVEDEQLFDEGKPTVSDAVAPEVDFFQLGVDDSFEEDFKAIGSEFVVLYVDGFNVFVGFDILFESRTY